MRHHSLPNPNLLARVRAWFGLDQAALALYLGISPSTAHSIEAGRRALTADIFMALRPLVLHLPPVEAAPPVPTAALPPGQPAPDAAELDFRRRVCLQQAARAKREMETIETRARVAQRWAQALPNLLQAAAETYAIPEPTNPDRGAWVAGWLARQARPLPEAAVTRWHLLRARLAALTAEVATLTDGAQWPPA
jgi:DNA-binding XRE family transcriptional regulator